MNLIDHGQAQQVTAIQQRAAGNLPRAILAHHRSQRVDALLEVRERASKLARQLQDLVAKIDQEGTGVLVPERGIAETVGADLDRACSRYTWESRTVRDLEQVIGEEVP